MLQNFGMSLVGMIAVLVTVVLMTIERAELDLVVDLKSQNAQIRNIEIENVCLTKICFNWLECMLPCSCINNRFCCSSCSLLIVGEDWCSCNSGGILGGGLPVIDCLCDGFSGVLDAWKCLRMQSWIWCSCAS